MRITQRADGKVEIRADIFGITDSEEIRIYDNLSQAVEHLADIVTELTRGYRELKKNNQRLDNLVNNLT